MSVVFAAATAGRVLGGFQWSSRHVISDVWHGEFGSGSVVIAQIRPQATARNRGGGP